MRAHILSIAAVAIGSQLASGSLAARRGIAPLATRPNVVLVIMDDIGYGDLGSYGVSDAKTPNLDRLAREGVRLTDGYANGPVCSPTRAALISGRYQQRVGIEWALSSVNDKDKSLPVTSTSLPAPLKTNGYATGLVIDRHASEPFFLEVAYNAVHWPFQPPDLPAGDPRRTHVPRPHEQGDRRLIQMADDAPPSTRADYVRILENADTGIGTILAALERNGLANNTLVIFTNDNGGEWLSRNAPLYHRRDSTPRSRAGPRLRKPRTGTRAKSRQA
jgi:arylsulfatase A